MSPLQDHSPDCEETSECAWRWLRMSIHSICELLMKGWTGDAETRGKVSSQSLERGFGQLVPARETKSDRELIPNLPPPRLSIVLKRALALRTEVFECAFRQRVNVPVRLGVLCNIFEPLSVALVAVDACGGFKNAW